MERYIHIHLFFYDILYVPIFYLYKDSLLLLVQKESFSRNKSTMTGSVYPPCMPLITQSCKIVSHDNSVSMLYLRNFLPKQWVAELAKDTWETDFNKLAKKRDNKRGEYWSVDLGIWKRRGGSNTYHCTPGLKKKAGREYVSKHMRVWQAIRLVMELLDADFIQLGKKSPFASIFAGAFSLAFVNTTSTSGLHRDEKDYKWCCIFPFGEFTGGHLLLPEIGAKVLFQPTDIAIFNSRDFLHQITNLEGKRSSVVLTSHYTVLMGKARIN